MTEKNISGDRGEGHYFVKLTAHRSLSPKGFVTVMLVFAAFFAMSAVIFYHLGAWPVLWLFGLEVLAVYIAFKVSYRAGRIYEMVDLRPDILKITRVLPSGRYRSWTFNPYWVRLNVRKRQGRASVLSISSHGKELVIGSFLSNSERAEFADELRAALLYCHA